MVVRVCTLDLHIPGYTTLKEKRLVLRSLVARLRQRHNLAVSEVDHHDLWQRASLCLVTVSNDSKVVHSVLDGVCNVWDWQADVLLSWSQEMGPVTTADWSPQGALLAVGFERGEVELRSVPSGSILRRVDTGERVLVRLGGDQNAVSGNLKKAIGSRNIQMADPDVVRETTGYVIGSIPAFGWQPPGLRSFLEASLLDEPVLGTGAGQWGEEIMITPGNLVRASQAIVVNLTDRDKPVHLE